MHFPEEQINELKLLAPDLSVAQEGGYTFLRIANLRLPHGCEPQTVDALLCPTPREGYNCRLFFSAPIQSKAGLNWNGNIRVLDQNWHAISYQTQTGLRLAEMLIIHLQPFRS